MKKMLAGEMFILMTAQEVLDNVVSQKKKNLKTYRSKEKTNTFSTELKSQNLECWIGTTVCLNPAKNIRDLRCNRAPQQDTLTTKIIR